jgi:hypothetical protein
LRICSIRPSQNEFGFHGPAFKIAAPALHSHLDEKRNTPMTISGRTKLIAHLGYPTESFKAPMIYNPYFERYSIDAVVVPMGCKAEDYAEFLKLVFKLSNIHGGTR